MNTIEASKGKWKEILLHYGVSEGILNSKHQCCPFCGGTDRFRWINKDGSGNFICNKCGHMSAIDYLIKHTGKEFKELACEIDKIVGNIQPERPQPKPNMAGKIHYIKKTSVPVKLVPEVQEYLGGRRLKPSKYLRALRSLKYFSDKQLIAEFPAMLAPFVSWEGKLLTWHVTYIKDGRKAPVENPKKILTPISKLDGGALRLTDIYPEIGITEGIETALAVMRDYEIPCWAASSANMMEKFKPPKGVRSIKIFGDNDLSFTGQKSAYSLAFKLKRIGFDIEVKIPDSVGDFADITKHT